MRTNIPEAALAILLSATVTACGRDANDPERSATIKDTVAQAGRAADAALETADVTTALLRQPGLDASGIDVDTDHNSKTVVLKGNVPTAEQKSLAESIAVKEATGYQVSNQLTVMPRQ